MKNKKLVGFVGLFLLLASPLFAQTLPNAPAPLSNNNGAGPSNLNTLTQYVNQLYFYLLSFTGVGSSSNGQLLINDFGNVGGATLTGAPDITITQPTSANYTFGTTYPPVSVSSSTVSIGTAYFGQLVNDNYAGNTNYSPALSALNAGMGVTFELSKVGTGTLTFTPKSGSGDTVNLGTSFAVPSATQCTFDSDGVSNWALSSCTSQIANTTLSALGSVTTYQTPGVNVWTKPVTPISFVRIRACGGGGGGGPGVLVASGTAASGGSGGAGGGCDDRIFAAADVPSTVTFTIGAGGSAGTGTSSGGVGTSTTYAINSVTYTGYGGGGGKAGASATAKAGGSGAGLYALGVTGSAVAVDFGGIGSNGTIAAGTPTAPNAGAGGGGSSSGGAGLAGGYNILGGPGGGAGGGVTTTGNGAIGTGGLSLGCETAPAVGTSIANGGSTAPTLVYFPGCGGSGGYGSWSNIVSGTNGGAGTNSGGGGGGGAALTTGVATFGTGGVGGNGYVSVYSW